MGAGRERGASVLSSSDEARYQCVDYNIYLLSVVGGFQNYGHNHNNSSHAASELYFVVMCPMNVRTQRQRAIIELLYF